MLYFCPHEVKLGSNSLANFSKKAERKNALNTVSITAQHTHHIKNEPNRCILQGVIAKNLYRNQKTGEERYTIFRAKIDHLNSEKSIRSIYIYSESTLDGLFKTLFFIPEVTKFKASRSDRMLSTASRGEIKGNVTGQFLWNSATKINPLSTVWSTVWYMHHFKKWAQSVHSRWSYSKK